MPPPTTAGRTTASHSRASSSVGLPLYSDGAMSWSAKQYVAFEDERTRPVRDLLGAVPDFAAGRAVDLGCGPGNSTEVLCQRFPHARVSGMDSSEDMIAAARARLPSIRFEVADMSDWNDPETFNVILANALFQWVPDHDHL